MAPITLVLPFALPVPEFAADLIRVLQAPALAALLSRTAQHRFHPLPPNARALPHELWIADALGLMRGVEPALATGVMRGYGLDPEDGTWFVVNPTHIQIARTHLMMDDLRGLDLREDEGRALFEAALPSIADSGYRLLYGAADTWFLRADAWDDLRTATPDAAVGMNLTDWMPTGDKARAFRKLQNDVQVTWYTHPVNAAREARGRQAINSIWPWGGASLATEQAHKLVAGARRRLGAPPALVTHAVPAWLDALATRRLESPSAFAVQLDGEGGDETVLVCGSVTAPAIAADWDGWLREMTRLETELFAPLLEAVKTGRVKQLRLVLSHRDGALETVTTPMAQRKFWRRPTLEALT
ncbi:hypothetical protein HH212_23250 [Massilia forsythiae]|uniref:Phosphoglycerate mutase n=1 Tax=Massilia forsythiae TaxID=2728020 RepID=A0A7Z2ZUE1_9BURK|nr:hypothetical protein [Massilia forsythiae]QJE02576.1 hypothetical protein HH212_23250 [Massilia forsythiae]